MAAESNTPTDIEIWLEKIINSCMTARHFYNVGRLVNLYIKRLQEEGMPYYQHEHIRDKFEGILWTVKEEIKNK